MQNKVWNCIMPYNDIQFQNLALNSDITVTRFRVNQYIL